MSVLFRYSTKKKDGIFVEKICFGRSLTPDSLEKNGYLYDHSYLDYLLEHQNIDKEFSIPLVNQIVEKFPWMKDIFTYVEKDNGSYYRFDLSKPADTVWFCLNVVRLILKGTQYNLQISEYNRLLENIEGDLWNKIIFLNSVFLNPEYTGVNGNSLMERPVPTGKYKLASFALPTHTCLLSPFYMEEEVMKAIFEDPFQVLNKLPSVIESKSGFLLKCKKDSYKYASVGDRNKAEEKAQNPFSEYFDRNHRGNDYNLYGVEKYWTSIEVMNGTHEIDTIPHQYNSICRSYKGFKDLKEWYLFCGLPEESFDKLFSNSIVVVKNGYLDTVTNNVYTR